ncbi:NTP transferase domain-containing protein [Candidatus Woesearchaeota archaeon]|nr:NTP transferase domain-containing protein [Candidatus Woesearchaeota archaeon]
MKVILPVAGSGKRMRPHTHSRPKHFLSIAGKPGIAYLLEELERLKVSEVIFITGHLKEKFEEMVRGKFKFKMRFVEQKVLDGTAGSVRLAEEFIDEPVLIIYPDAVFDLDLGLIDKLKKDESGIIWVKHREDYQRFGVVVLDKDGYMSRMVEKPSEPISKLANIGYYYVRDYKLLYEGIKHLYDNKIMMKGEYWLTDAFQYMIEHGAKFICPDVKGWYDYGKPETHLDSNRELLKKFSAKDVPADFAENSVIRHPVFIAPGVKIKNSVIGPYVTIESGCTVDGCVIQDSIIHSGSKVRHVLLDKSIVGDEVELEGGFKELNVGDHCTISFSEKRI